MHTQMHGETAWTSDQLAAVIESSYDGICIVHPDGIIQLVNESYVRITGLSREEVVGKSGRDLVEAGKMSNSVTDRVISQGRPVMVVTQYKTGRSAVLVGSPVMAEDGTVAKVVINLRDVTELYSLREELNRARVLTERYQSEAERLRVQQTALEGIVCQSQRMQELIQLSLTVARVDSTVLLLGESGTGKGLLAQVIHRGSRRAERPFIAVNCAAIPFELLESELFGYDGGAFTGARRQGKPGVFELADGGTLLLDEIGEMSPGLQAKLLSVMQERQFRRVGGVEPISVDVRVIAATNRDLDALVGEGQFREDLYYRLNVVPLHLPPLRQRPEDIAALAFHFLERFCQRYRLSRHLTNEAITCLLGYRWPGNVRELENVIERAVVTCPKEAIEPEDLPLYLQGPTAPGGLVEVRGLVPLHQALEEVERKLYQEAARHCSSSYEVARVLQVSQPTAYRKLRKYVQDAVREDSCEPSVNPRSEHPSRGRA